LRGREQSGAKYGTSSGDMDVGGVICGGTPPFKGDPTKVQQGKRKLKKQVNWVKTSVGGVWAHGRQLQKKRPPGFLDELTARKGCESNRRNNSGGFSPINRPKKLPADNLNDTNGKEGYLDEKSTNLAGTSCKRGGERDQMVKMVLER